MELVAQYCTIKVWWAHNSYGIVVASIFFSVRGLRYNHVYGVSLTHGQNP